MLIRFELADSSSITQHSTVLVNTDHIAMVTTKLQPGPRARTVAQLSVVGVGAVDVLLGENLSDEEREARLNSLVVANRGTHLEELGEPLED